MKKAIDSQANLKDFVEHFDLSDNNSNIDFIGRIQISTNNKQFNGNARVMITFHEFDSFGMVTIIHEKLDATQYPIQFEAKFQPFKFVDSVYLKTSGQHSNPYIGNYNLKISV